MIKQSADDWYLDIYLSFCFAAGKICSNKTLFNSLLHDLELVTVSIIIWTSSLQELSLLKLKDYSDLLRRVPVMGIGSIGWTFAETLKHLDGPTTCRQLPENECTLFLMFSNSWLRPEVTQPTYTWKIKN